MVKTVPVTFYDVFQGQFCFWRRETFFLLSSLSQSQWADKDCQEQSPLDFVSVVANLRSLNG